MADRVAGNVALVTGDASGDGRPVAELPAQEGASVELTNSVMPTLPEQRKEAGVSEFLDRVEWWIRAWHGISAPNEQAHRTAAALEDMIRKVEGLRGTLQFEDQPASFEAALTKAKGKA